MNHSPKKFDVIAIGDLILNFSYAGKNSDGIALYERQPAGATANILTQVARLGGKAALISTLGNDEHSRYLYAYEENCGIDMTNVHFGNLPTRIMFVYYTEDNDRYFSDFMMKKNELDTAIDNVNYEMIESSRYLNVKCMPYQADQPIFHTMKRILQTVEEANIPIAVDAQWRGAEMTKEEKRHVRNMVAISKVVKLTDVEMNYYFEESDPLRGTEKILNTGDTQLVALTLDSRGCLLRSKNACVYEPGFKVAPKDTTGAGDSYMGSLLYSLSRLEKEPSMMTAHELSATAEFCNACAAYSTQFRGSLAHMCTLEQADRMIRDIPKYEPWNYFR